MKKNIYVCITESLCYTAEIRHNTVNQLYFNKNCFLKSSRGKAHLLKSRKCSHYLPCARNRGYKPVQDELPNGSQKRAHSSAELEEGFPTADSTEAL